MDISIIKTIYKNKYNLKLVLVSNKRIKLLKSNDIIVMTDDCIYSGMQMKSNITKDLGTNKNPKTKLIIYLLLV